MKHILHKSISGSSHQIIIHLVGVGGTGSHVLTNLAMMNKALIHLERQPLYVLAIDPDTVEESNIGRQVFSPADVGENKAKVLVERINRYFGFAWDYADEEYETLVTYSMGPDIIIGCVDSVVARAQIWRTMDARRSAIYWMDIGNNLRQAQILLAEKENPKMPHFFAEFPNEKDDPNDLTPSCSAMESLNRQDLFVNKIVATYATHMLWQLMKDFVIDYRGMYVNLETMQTTKIPIQ
jgi:PRTRC genetic system ThiF family protein